MGYFDDILIEEEPRKPAKQASSSGFFDDILGEDEASRTKREYVEQGGKPEDVYSPERLQTLVEQGPAALAAEPPLKRQDGSIAGPTLPTEEALAKGLIEKNAEPAVRKAMAEGVETVSSGFDREKGVGFAVGRDEDGKVVRVEEKPKKQTSGFFDDIIGDDMSVDNQPLINQPIPNPIARESVGRFAKGAIVEPAAALARTYGMAEAAIGIPVKGEPYPVESTAGGRLARGIEALGERIYPPVKEAQGSFIPEVAGGLGQVTGMVAGGVGARALGASAAVAERAVPMATGVVMGAGEGVKRAADANADPEAQLMSGFLNGAVGLSEVFPTERWISKIDKATGGQLSTGVKRYLADIGTEATTEAIQEAFQSTMGNIIAKGQYNPDQEIGAEVGKSATVGGTVGGIASAVIGAFGLRGRRTSKATPDVATTEPQSEPIQQQAQVQQEGLQPFTEFQRPEERERVEIKFDPKDGIGAVPYNQEVDYRGFVKSLTPEQFLNNTAELKGETSASGIEKAIRNGEAIGNPFLDVQWDGQERVWRVVGHEGRNRAVAINRIDPSTQIPVHFFPKGLRARDITDEMRVAPIIPEKGAKPIPESPANQERVTSQEITQPTLTSFESPKDLERAFSDIGEGHRRFASRLSTMITFDAMTPEARDLILATIYDNNVNDEYLQQIEVGPLTRGARPAGRGGVVTQPVQGKPDAITGQVTSKGNKPFLGIKQGARLTSIKDRDFEFLDIFWHEYGHAGYYSLLTSDQKKLVSSEYKKTTRKGRSEFFLKGTARGLDRYADYYAKNESEWFAQSFSEWVITEKTSQTKLVPLFEKILQRLKNVFEKLFQRKNIESLSDIYEYILKGEAYGKKPLWSRWDMSRNPTDYDRPIKRIDRNFIKVQKRLDQKAGESRIDGQQFKNISQPESKPPSSIEPPSPPPTQPPASPEPQPNPMPKIPSGAKLKPYLDNFRRTFQDKFVDVENLQKRITKGQFELPDAVNIKQAEELYHGRTGERLTEFDENTARPLIEEISALNIGANLPWVKAIGDKYYKGRKNPDGSDRKFVPSRDIFDLYAIAKHGTERNQLIAQRTPELAGRGSGLTDAQIKSILETEIPENVRARMEPIRQRLVEMSRRALADKLAGGLINQETYDLLTTRFQDYVPLRGKDGGTEFERMEGTGTGFDVRGREIRRAEGRESLPTDVVAYAIMQSTDSIIRAEKNAVMQTAARFAEAYPDNGVIEKVGRGELMRTYGIETDDGTIYRRFVDEALRTSNDIIVDEIAHYAGSDIIVDEIAH